MSAAGLSRRAPHRARADGEAILSSQAPESASDTLARRVAAANEDPERSLNPLLASLRPNLVRYFAGRLPGDIAEDLAQDTLIRITRALPSIEPDRADRLIATIAVNVLRTEYAKRAREHRRTADEDVAMHVDSSASAAIERQVEYQELARAVHRVCAAELPETLQQVVLGLLRGESPAEIATRVGISPVTVRTRLFRARRILRRALSAHLPAPSNRQEAAKKPKITRSSATLIPRRKLASDST